MNNVLLQVAVKYVLKYEGLFWCITKGIKQINTYNVIILITPIFADAGILTIHFFQAFLAGTIIVFFIRNRNGDSMDFTPIHD